MVNENEYINQVWEKYENCQKHSKINEKYKTQIYKEVKNKLVIKSFLSILTIIFSTISVAYAGVTGYTALSQKFDKTDYNIIQDYSQSEDMIYQDGLYYQKIMTFKKYEECCKKWENLIQMTEEDFKENFVLVVAIESGTIQRVSVDEIKTEENQMCVMFNRDLARNDDENIISIKVPKEKNRENIVFKIKYDSGTYTKLEELPVNYTEEDALMDGCVVIVGQKLVKNSLENWNEFLGQVQNENNSFIRIVIFNEAEKSIIRDVEYKDGIYYIATDYSRTEKERIIYKIGYYLNIKDHKDSMLIFVEDKHHNQIPVLFYEY